MKMENSLKTLDDFYKNVKMGIEAYSMVSSKVQDEDLKEEINYQYNKHRNILEKLEDVYEECGEMPVSTPFR